MIYQYTIISMNIIAETLNSKPTTQAMLTSFLQDMKQYFKNSQLLNEDKTYARILKIAQTTQKCMPHFYSITNIAMKLICTLRERVDDKFEDLTQPQNKIQSKDGENKQAIANDDIQSLDRLQSRLSHENQNSLNSLTNLNRQVNQQFMRKLVLDVISQILQQIQESQNAVIQNLQQLIEQDSVLFLFDSHLQNKNLITKIANEKKLKIKYIKKSNADYKNNEINLSEVASQVCNARKVIISAESILRNGAIISESGSLMVALAAKKYQKEVIVIGRSFCLTDKPLIDQHVLLSENPMKFYKKAEENQLKVYIGKRFDLLESRLVNQIVSDMGVVNPSNVELHFMSYYNYN